MALFHYTVIGPDKFPGIFFCVKRFHGLLHSHYICDKFIIDLVQVKKAKSEQTIHYKNKNGSKRVV